MLTIAAVALVAHLVTVPPPSALRIAEAQTLPVATTNDAIGWDYLDAEVTAGSIAVFVVCLDRQPTADCARVPVTAGVASTTPGLRTFTWKLPPLLGGSHMVAVQACTANASSCSSGVTLQFTVQIILADPRGIRLVKSGGGGER